MRQFAALALLIASAAAAQAPGGPPPGGPPPGGRNGPLLGRQGPTIVAEPVAVTLAGFDADGDGLLTRAEANAGALRSFAAIAKGARDFGYIGYSSWALRWLGDANALPNPFDVDADHDNRITSDEIVATVMAAFNRFDVNKDGVLTRAELITVRASAFGDDRDWRGRKRASAPAPQGQPPRQ